MTSGPRGVGARTTGLGRAEKFYPWAETRYEAQVRFFSLFLLFSVLFHFSFKSPNLNFESF
jgi:hypothetical protein